MRSFFKQWICAAQNIRVVNLQRKIVFLLVLALMSLSACQLSLFSYRESVQNLLEQLLKNDTAKLVSETGEAIGSLSNGGMSAKIMENVSFKIQSVKTKKGALRADVVFTYPDMVKLSEEFSGVGQKTEGFEKWLNSKLSGKFPVQKRKVSLKLTEINEEFYIVASNELYDVMTGGAFNFVGQQEQEAYKKWLEQVQK